MTGPFILVVERYKLYAGIAADFLEVNGCFF